MARGCRSRWPVRSRHALVLGRVRLVLAIYAVLTSYYLVLSVALQDGGALGVAVIGVVFLGSPQPTAAPGAASAAAHLLPRSPRGASGAR